MATNSYAEGDVITVTAALAISEGDIVPLTQFAGVAIGSAVTGGAVEVAIGGVWDVAKATGVAVAQGQCVYSVTTTGGEKGVIINGTEALGTCVMASATGDTTVRVLLENVRNSPAT